MLQLILELASGDLRKAITFLQTAQRLHSAGSSPTPITSMSSKLLVSTYRSIAETVVHEISGVVPGDVVNSLLAAMGIEAGEGVSPALLKGGFEAVRTAIKRVGREGWSAGQILEQIHDAIIPLPTIPVLPKSLAAMAIAECDKALCEGGDEELQLLECCLRIREAMTRS